MEQLSVIDGAEFLNNSLLQVNTDTSQVLEDEGATDLNGEATAVEGGYLINKATHSQSGVAPLCRERPCASSRLALNKNERTLKYAPQVARVVSQNGVTSFASTDDSGVTLSVSEKGIQSVYGARGDDTLIGDGNDNWLGGGRGSDTLLAA